MDNKYGVNVIRVNFSKKLCKNSFLKGALFLYGIWMENAPEYGIWEEFTQIWNLVNSEANMEFSEFGISEFTTNKKKLFFK